MTSNSSAPAHRIELARDVVEQQHRRLAQPRLDVGQLGQLERQHQRAQLPLRGVAARRARRRGRSPDRRCAGPKPVKPAALVEPPARRQAGVQRGRAPPASSSAARRRDRCGSASDTGRSLCSARKCSRNSGRQRRHQRPPPHHHPRPRARQLLVVGVEQLRVGGPRACSSAFRLLQHLLERARLVVVAALDVEDGQVEEAPPRRPAPRAAAAGPRARTAPR